MTVTTTTAIITALKADTGLRAALGGSSNVFPRHRQAAQMIPGVYVMSNAETSTRRPGYRAGPAFKIRDNAATIQCDIFDNRTAALADAIADAVDVALLSANVTGTRGWRRVSRSEQFEEETRLHHIALRFSFEYSITDS